VKQLCAQPGGQGTNRLTVRQRRVIAKAEGPKGAASTVRAALWVFFVVHARGPGQSTPLVGVCVKDFTPACMCIGRCCPVVNVYQDNPLLETIHEHNMLQKVGIS
jgi:hypothetical protein